LKKIKRTKNEKFKFINRNVSIGGIRKCIRDGDYDKAKSMFDGFNKTCSDRIDYLKSNYGSQINAIKNNIKKCITDDEEKNLLKTKHEAMLRAKKKAKEDELKAKQEALKIEKDELERQTAMKLKTKQELLDSQHLFQKQQEFEAAQREKEDKKNTRKEEINKKRRETREFNIKEKEITGLVDEYGTLISRKKDLIGAGEESRVEREQVEFDIGQILKIAKKHDLDEGDLAWRFRQHVKLREKKKGNKK
jgi:hypothetical protein